MTPEDERHLKLARTPLSKLGVWGPPGIARPLKDVMPIIVDYQEGDTLLVAWQRALAPWKLIIMDEDS